MTFSSAAGSVTASLHEMVPFAGTLCAFLNLPDGAGGTTTIESKTNVVRAVKGGHATAVSRPLHVGRRFVIIETDVLDDQERLAARVTQTQAVL